jgi:Mg2+ and Co2+ transporter CorA
MCENCLIVDCAQPFFVSCYFFSFHFQEVTVRIIGLLSNILFFPNAASACVSRHYALDLQEVEDLLETYFTHIDSTFAELQALDEFIDDTEDFVNIELDSQRNQLIKLELILTTGTLFVSIYGVVAGVFGMNLRNGAEDSKHTFVLVNIICGVGTIVSFILAVFFIRFKRIM